MIKYKEKGKKFLYFLTVKSDTGGWLYNDWYSISQLLKIKAVSIKSEDGLRIRIMKEINNVNADLWKIITARALVGRKKKQKHKRNSKDMDIRDEFVSVLSLFAVR